MLEDLKNKIMEAIRKQQPRDSATFAMTVGSVLTDEDTKFLDRFGDERANQYLFEWAMATGLYVRVDEGKIVMLSELN